MECMADEDAQIENMVTRKTEGSSIDHVAWQLWTTRKL